VATITAANGTVNGTANVTVIPTPITLWGPYITGTTTNSTGINWKTENATNGTVKYATEAYYKEHGGYDHTIEDMESKQLHHVAIANLTPNTVYHYQLIIGNESTSDYTFRTFPTEGSFTFVVYGDTREQTGLFTQMERHKLVADRIAEEENVSFVVHTGDFVCSGSDLDEWNRFFDAGRAMLANITIYPVLGNHEDNHTNYYDAFGVPEWYSFDCGNVHFTVLDDNDWASPHTAEQAEWLRNDLNTSAAWKFVSFHHPPYSSSETHWGGWKNDVWENIFINSSVDAVFNGHVHVYERYEENGIQYVVLGCGGAPLYNLEEEKIPGYQNSFEHTLGYAKIRIEGNKATMDTIKVADVSEDNKVVTYIYPPNTIFETVVLRQTKTWYVDDSGGADFTTIQAAVDAANAGDTIIVRNGTYTENVDVDKSLTIKSENGSAVVTVMAAVPTAPVFDVNADGVTIDGFAVSGPTNEHVAGIELVDVNSCTIVNTDCSGGCYNGIHLGGAATNNTVTRNYCHNNTRRGISLRDTATGNFVTENTCENNADDELCIKDMTHDNFVWLNNFMGTVECLTDNTYHSPAQLTYTYNGSSYTNYLGNYYSGYAGVDTSPEDGIGDTPYNFSGSSYRDDYPLMMPFEQYLGAHGLCGDVNKDGVVNVLDATKVWNRAGNSSYPLDDEWAADVNCDGSINELDATEVKNRAGDPNYPLDCCTP
jgi:parallel beta-helix repeat protein